MSSSSERGWAKHERRRKAEERRNQPLSLQYSTPEEKQRRLTTASWAAVRGLLNMETARIPLLHSIYEEISVIDEYGNDGPTRKIIKGYYDASYKDATNGDGFGTNNRSEFRKQYAQNKTSENYNPLMITRAEPLLKMIDGFMFKPVGGKK